MRIVATKKSILTALDRVSRIVKSNPRAVEILQCIKVSTYSDTLYFTASSSMASARVAVTEAKIARGGSFVVNFDRFKDRVSKASSGMAMEVEGDFLKITSSDDQRLGLRLNNLNEFPNIEWSLSEESYGLDKNDTVSLFNKAVQITSTSSPLTPSFMQVHIEDQQLWAANGMSYNVFPMTCNPSLKTSIPVTTLAALSSFILESGGDKIWLSQGDGDRVVASVGMDQFQTTPLAISFPDLDPMFDRVKVASIHELSFNRKAMLGELSKAKSSVDEFGRVTWNVPSQATTLIEVSTNSEVGDWYESKVSALWTGPPERKLVFNLESLTHFMKTFDEEEITFNIGDDFRGELSAVYCKEGKHVGIINQFRV